MLIFCIGTLILKQLYGFILSCFLCLKQRHYYASCAILVYSLQCGGGATDPIYAVIIHRRRSRKTKGIAARSVITIVIFGLNIFSRVSFRIAVWKPCFNSRNQCMFYTNLVYDTCRSMFAIFDTRIALSLIVFARKFAT